MSQVPEETRMAWASPHALEVGLARTSRQVLASEVTCAPQARRLSAMPLLATATRPVRVRLSLGQLRVRPDLIHKMLCEHSS